MDNPLVSVILPTYAKREGGFLERAIRSVMAQTYVHFELIVVDDGSVDGSEQFIKACCEEDSRIKTIRMRSNIGIPAITTALAYLQSAGKYIAFLFDDCVYNRGHLQTLVQKMESEPSLGMAYGQASMIRRDGKVETLGKPYDKEQMAIMGNHTPNITVMIKRSVIDDVGWLDPHVLLKRCCDWDLWMRIADKYPIGFIPLILAEEFGTSLSESLGHSYTIQKDLVLKYVKKNRNAMLLPSRILQYDPYQSDFGDALTNEEKRIFNLIVLEHHLRACDISAFIQTAAEQSESLMKSELRLKQITAKNNSADMDNRMVPLWLAILDYCDWRTSYFLDQLDRNRNDLFHLFDLANEKDAFIREQQQYIEKQERYIADQYQLILLLQSKL